MDTVKNPDEVFDGVPIHREQKTCKVYIKDIETNDGTQKKLVLIADTETGLAYLGSTLTEQEYSHLKKNWRNRFIWFKKRPSNISNELKKYPGSWSFKSSERWRLFNRIHWY